MGGGKLPANDGYGKGLMFFSFLRSGVRSAMVKHQATVVSGGKMVFLTYSQV